MAQVAITINGRTYQIACDEGQERHVAQLAGYVDNKVTELAATVGQVGDARLLVMASLMIADELADAYSDLDKAAGGTATSAAAASDPAVGEAAAAVEEAALRIERIADRLKRT